jgi:CheY-like chemotaxis protein
MGHIRLTSPGGRAMTAPRVLIVDDELDSCWLVAFVLRQDPNLSLAGEATDGEMAVSLVRQERPDVVVMDLMMPRFGGLEAIPRIKREWPDTKVLVLTHLTGDATPARGVREGRRCLPRQAQHRIGVGPCDLGRMRARTAAPGIRPKEISRPLEAAPSTARCLAMPHRYPGTAPESPRGSARQVEHGCAAQASGRCG